MPASFRTCFSAALVIAVDPAPHGIRQGYRYARIFHLFELKSIRVPVAICWNRLPQLAEHHRHELARTPQSFRHALRTASRTSLSNFGRGRSLSISLNMLHDALT
jgi:hypothetical protein